MRACKEQIWFSTHVWKRGKKLLLFAERSPPEIGGVGLGDAERVSLELSARKDGFDLGQHVTEDQRELGEVSPEREREKRNAPGSVQQTDKKSAVIVHVRGEMTSLLFYWAEMLEFLALELVWKLICLASFFKIHVDRRNLMHSVWRASSWNAVFYISERFNFTEHFETPTVVVSQLHT